MAEYIFQPENGFSIQSKDFYVFKLGAVPLKLFSWKKNCWVFSSVCLSFHLSRCSKSTKKRFFFLVKDQTFSDFFRQPTLTIINVLLFKKRFMFIYKCLCVLPQYNVVSFFRAPSFLHILQKLPNHVSLTSHHSTLKNLLFCMNIQARLYSHTT